MGFHIVMFIPVILGMAIYNLSLVLVAASHVDYGDAPPGSLPADDGGSRVNQSLPGPDGRHLTPEVVQEMVLLSVFMVIALTGNGSVLFYLFRTQGVQRPVSIFVMALAFTDILIALLSMSTEILWNAFGGEWVFGAAGCKLLTYAQGMLFGSTAFILMSMSYDRYEAICKPMFLSRTIARSRRMIFASWASAAVMAIPQLFVFLQVPNGFHSSGTPKYLCKSEGYTVGAPWQRQAYMTYLTTYIFLIPVTFVAVCYIKIATVVWQSSKPTPSSTSSSALTLRRNTTGTTDTAKVKTIKLTVCILSCYIVCWSPYFAGVLMKAFAAEWRKRNVAPVVHMISHCMAWSSSCVNPVIYLAFNIPTKGLFDICFPKQAQTRVRLQESPRPSVQPLTTATNSRRGTTVSVSSSTKELRPPLTTVTTLSRVSFSGDSLLVSQPASWDPRKDIVMI